MRADYAAWLLILASACTAESGATVASRAQTVSLAPLPRTITSVAGYDHRDGLPIEDTAIIGPRGLAFDSAGNLYYLDMNLEEIRRVDSVTHVVTTVAGNGFIGSWVPPTTAEEGVPATQARLAGPGSAGGDAIAIDDRNILYIVDTWNNRIRAVNLNPPGTPPIDVCTVSIEPGLIRTIAGNGVWDTELDGQPATSGPVLFPFDIAVDRGYNVYFTEQEGSGLVRRVDATTGVVTRVAGNGDCHPGTLASTDNGPALAAPLCNPRALAFDASQRYLYVTTMWWGIGGSVRRIDLQTGNIRNYAGTGIASTGGDGGPAADAGIGETPGTLVFDAAGNLFIADQNNGQIRRIDARNRIISVVAGGPGFGYSAADNGAPAMTASLNSPQAIAFHDGKLYIAESGNGVITWVNPDPSDGYILGRPTELLHELGSEVGPKGVYYGASDLAGNFLLQSNSHPRIQKVDRAGNLTTVVGGNQTFGFSGDGGPAIDAQVAAWFLTVDPVGDLYISDPVFNLIRRVRALPGPSGKPEIMPTSTIELVAAPPFMPGSLAFNGNTMYVADVNGNRVWAMDRTSGAFALFAGNGQSGYAGEGGPATAASFNALMDLIYDASRSALYVLDSPAVRRIDLKTGIISTLAEVPPPCPDPWCSAAVIASKMVGDRYLFLLEASAVAVWRLDLSAAGSAPVLAVGPGDFFSPVGMLRDEESTVGAHLGGPNTFMVDPAGKLYIIDGQSERVRRVGNVDILPGQFPNVIQRKPSVHVAVAILSTYDFDAASIDPKAVTVAGAPLEPKSLSFQDVDGDGRPDMLFTVRGDQLQLAPADGEAAVLASTFAGKPFVDADWVTLR
jgi:sugar lactone lactonase YvrE